MRKLTLGALVAATALAGCGGGPKGGVFASGKGPDEFAVSRQAPLTVPPDFQLAPPRPGAPRPQDADSSVQALTAMFGGEAARSASERGLVNQAGGARIDPAIRSTAGDPGTTVVNKGSATRDLIQAPASQGTEATVAVPQ